MGPIKGAEIRNPIVVERSGSTRPLQVFRLLLLRTSPTVSMPNPIIAAVGGIDTALLSTLWEPNPPKVFCAKLIHSKLGSNRSLPFVSPLTTELSRRSVLFGIKAE